MPHLLPPPVPDSNLDPNPDPNLDLEVDSYPTPLTTDSNQLSLANILAYCTTDVHTHKIYSAIPPLSYPGVRTPSPSRACLPWGSAFLVNSAWERYIESAERVYRGCEDGVKRILVKLATWRRRKSGRRIRGWCRWIRH